MTRDEAVTVVSMIVNSWPGAVWETAKLDAYVEAILPLDAALTTLAVASAVQKLKYRPSIAELREFIQIERRLSEADEAHYILPDAPAKPKWVERWERARAVRDTRPFPEQQHALDMLARSSPENYRVYAPPEQPVTDALFWVQAHEYLSPESAVGAIVTA